MFSIHEHAHVPTMKTEFVIYYLQLNFGAMNSEHKVFLSLLMRDLFIVAMVRSILPPCLMKKNKLTRSFKGCVPLLLNYCITNFFHYYNRIYVMGVYHSRNLPSVGNSFIFVVSMYQRINKKHINKHIPQE